MAEFDQDSKQYIADAIKEMQQKKEPTVTPTTDTPECPTCNDNGLPNGCDNCGATA
jgi:hypothetical protein